MGLPATETIDPAMAVESPWNDGIQDIYNGTGAALAAGDFAVFDEIWSGIVQAAIASTATGPVKTKAQMIIQTATLHTSLNTFGTRGGTVFWDDTLKKFVDTTATGRFNVGRIVKVKDSAGVIVFEKHAYPVKV